MVMAAPVLFWLVLAACAGADYGAIAGAGGVAAAALPLLQPPLLLLLPPLQRVGVRLVSLVYAPRLQRQRSALFVFIVCIVQQQRQ